MGHLLIQPIAEPNISPGGIILPVADGNSDNLPIGWYTEYRAIVLVHEMSEAWGEEEIEGRLIIYDKHAVRYFEIDRTRFAVVPEESVLALVEE